MTDDKSQATASAVSDLANALQIAIPAAARLREHLDGQAQEADRLEDALTRAMQAIRQLQPSRGREPGGPR
jgi:hypothetical protein